MAPSLLSLPGELKNQIFEYLTDGSLSHESMVAVTQTCQSLRRDFRPYMLSTQAITVHFHDLQRYLEAFYPLATPDVMRAYRGQILINLQDHYADKVTVDILPLAAHILQCPRISLSFHAGTQPRMFRNECRDLTELFQIIRLGATAAWQTRMGDFASVKLPPYPYHAGQERNDWVLEIAVNPEVGQAWVAKGASQSGGVQQLLRDLGLQGEGADRSASPFRMLGCNLL